MILIEELFKVHILLDFNGHATQSSVSTNLMFSQSFFMHQCCNTKAHCSLLDIYLSQKKTVCSKFGTPISNVSRGQTNQLFNLKIQIYYINFSSIFCSSCQIKCFLHTVAAISKSWHTWIAFWCKNHNLDMSTLWNISNSV